VLTEILTLIYVSQADQDKTARYVNPYIPNILAKLRRELRAARRQTDKDGI
jgi:hypothetical protein